MMMALSYILMTVGVLILSYSYGKLSRMAGGGKPSLPFGLDAWLWGVPFGIAGSLTDNGLSYWIFGEPFIGFIIAYCIAVLGKRLGHGQYFDLKTFVGRIIEPEKIDFIVKLFFGRDPQTKYPNKTPSMLRELFGLFLKGVIGVLGLAILLFLEGSLILTILAVIIGGLSMSLTYYIPRKFEKTNRKFLEKIGVKFDEPKGHTEPAEWNRGIFTGIFIFSLIILLTLT